ncbi:hypothetical protein DFH09DRAFT_1374638 [Mycena vulgaris]|nr:hypothetical protein DFH09DRAFT_1374638 [Mycena vulgaris]
MLEPPRAARDLHQFFPLSSLGERLACNRFVVPGRDNGSPSQRLIDKLSAAFKHTAAPQLHLRATNWYASPLAAILMERARSSSSSTFSAPILFRGAACSLSWSRIAVTHPWGRRARGACRAWKVAIVVCGLDTLFYDARTAVADAQGGAKTCSCPGSGFDLVIMPFMIVFGLKINFKGLFPSPTLLGIIVSVDKLFNKRALADLSDEEVNTVLEYINTMQSGGKRAVLLGSVGKGITGLVADLFKREISFNDLD